MFLSRPLRYRLPLVTLVIMSVFGIALSTLLYAQMSSLVVEQRVIIGQTLATQMSQSAKQAMVHNDTVSLQVMVESLVEHTRIVERASIFNLDHDLLAQSQRSINSSSVPVAFTATVSVEDSIGGYVTVEVQPTRLFSREFSPLWIALALWIVVTTALTIWLFKQGQSLSLRLRSLSRQLPGSRDREENDDGDELANLERRIAPLLVNIGVPESGAVSYGCTLALHCSNLPRLKAQLSRDNFEDLLSGLDQTLDSACRLYDGKRLSSFQQSVFIYFGSAAEDGDQALHALFCACATLEIIRSKALDQGVSIELSAALSVTPETRTSSTLIADLDRQEHLHTLAALLPLAGPWQILIARPFDTQAGIADCANFETLPNAQDVARFVGFAPNQRALLDRQLIYLQAQSEHQD